MLWSRRTVGVFAAGNVVALVLVLVASGQAAGKLRTDGQMPYVSLAVLALVVSGVANAGLLIQARRALAIRLGEFRLLAPAQSVGPVGGDEFVSASNAVFFHRPSCVLVEGKPVQAASRQMHEGAARKPCKVCAP